MTELELYKKMYATVISQADDILQELAVTLTDQNCGWKELHDFGEKLKQALLDAEEIYMSAEDEEDEEDELSVRDCLELQAEYKKAEYDAMCAESIALSEPFMRKLDEKVKQKAKEQET